MPRSHRPGGSPPTLAGPLPNKRLQLTPNSSLQSIRGTVLAAGTVPQRWWSALLGAAEPPIRGGWVAGKTAQNRKLRKRYRRSETGASAERNRSIVVHLLIACAVISLLVLGLDVEPFSSYLRSYLRLHLLGSLWGLAVLLLLVLGILAEFVHRARRSSSD